MPFILLTVAVCFIVWGSYLALRGSILGGCVAFLILTTCFSNNFFEFEIAGATLTLDRLFLVGLVVAALVQWRLGYLTISRPNASEILVGLFLALLVVSTFSHDWRSTSSVDVSIVMRLINGFVVPMVIFFIARMAPLRERNVSLVHISLAVFGVYLAVTALLEVTGQWSLVFPRYIADPELGIHFGRARGPALQAVINGSVLVMALIVFWLTWGWQAKGGRVGQLAAVTLLPLFAAAIFATYTRSVWLGAGLAGGLILTCTLSGVWRPVVLTGLAGLVLIVGVAKRDSLIGLEREDSAAVTRESTYMRASFTYVSWEMFKDKPFLGFGFGQFPREKETYLSDRSTALHLESIRGYVHHNTFLSVLTETGLVGFSIYLAMLATWARNGWRLWHNADTPAWIRAHGLMLLSALLCYTAQMVFHDVTYSPIDNSMIFLLAGIAAGLQTEPAAATFKPTASVANPGRLNVATMGTPVLQTSAVGQVCNLSCTPVDSRPVLTA